MDVYEFGKENQRSIVMIHGTGMCWDMFQGVAELLCPSLHVILVSVPGHDPSTREEFTSVEQVAAEVEDTLLSAGHASIDVLYGLSMGGGIAIRMLADARLDVRYAVIDAGITPYELPYPVTRLILIRDFLMTEWGKHSKKALSLAFPPSEYTQPAVDRMFAVLRHMTARTIWRVYDSTDNYSMPAAFPETCTRIEYWFGEKEKRERKLDIRYVRRHIPNVFFRELPGMLHGQYVMTRPEAFAGDIQKILKGETSPSTCGAAEGAHKKD